MKKIIALTVVLMAVAISGCFGDKSSDEKKLNVAAKNTVAVDMLGLRQNALDITANDKVAKIEFTADVDQTNPKTVKVVAGKAQVGEFFTNLKAKEVTAVAYDAKGAVVETQKINLK